MSITRWVKAYCTFAGIHFWPGAPKGHFLGHPHRHLFHVRAFAVVGGPDREIEFIALKEKIERYCIRYFRGPHTLSCEMMAEQLLRHFRLAQCQVDEDGENGAVVMEEGWWKEKKE